MTHKIGNFESGFIPHESKPNKSFGAEAMKDCEPPSIKNSGLGGKAITPEPIDSKPKGVERKKLLEIMEQVYRLGTIDGKNGAYLLHPSINATDAIMKLLEGR